MANALSGRNVGRTLTPNPLSAIFLWYSRSLVGSSVVQTTSTRLSDMHFLAVSPPVRTAFALSQTSCAVPPESSRSSIPKNRASSRWHQWYIGLPSIRGMASANFWNFSLSGASPVQKRSFAPSERIARHL